MHSLRTAHHIAESLAEAGVPDEPVVLDRRGPHRSIAGLERLLDDALEEEAAERRDEGRDVGDDGNGDDEGC
ncbi:hypothetical protein [Actinomycetospora straminea]|uniref:hypothetical protein n=1 Tax=Actinomycetospora straminea TaxID=663607 RepID=UPI002365885C|nr:hypothetical protein [Actinomycetospora straminea]MDD7931506.1 hypothetical protein [Actinomycetospora straminea]